MSKLSLFIGTSILALVAAVVGLAAVLDLKFVLLWTDLLIYILLIVMGLFIVQARRKEHLRRPWQYVAQRPLAMAAVVVLSGYLLIGLLDSVHFREALEQQAGQDEVHYSGEVVTILDKLVTPLRTRQEKSYSAPFSSYLYSKETVDTPQGRTRAFPRLQYGGRHLTDPARDFQPDLVKGAGISLIYSLLFWLIILVPVTRLTARRSGISSAAMARRMVTGKTDLPFRSIFMTVGLLSYLIIFIIIFADKYHILGTDKVGNDVLYLSLKSIRTGLVFGTLTTLIMLPFAVLLGITAGYFRGWVDDIIQYIYTTLSSIPGVLLIAAAILSLQVYMTNHPDMFETVTERAELRLLFLCIILGITSWTGLCRLLRAETLKVCRLDYIEAARSFGTGHFTIITRHILPNVMHIILISVVLDFSGLVLVEAVLSYVGVGVDPVTISWGNMINIARLEMAREPVVWWSLAAAFVFMFTLVLAANLFSDAVRDAFDPRITRAE
ncbi:MAG: ABC transporter permease [Candidatus Electrothrix sp. ATG2]|nr:ABC transporter permease [Candidatus Electrothrix sp. ATG2]